MAHHYVRLPIKLAFTDEKIWEPSYSRTILGVLTGSILLITLFARLIALGPREEKEEEEEDKHTRVPRSIPYTFPFLRSTISFLFNSLSFFSYISFAPSHEPRRLNPQPTVHRIALLTDDVYLVRGARSIVETIRHPSLSVNLSYAMALKYCFGMRDAAVASYLADTSGSREKPIAGSDTAPRNRILFRSHENIHHGLLGSGLTPTSDRFEKYLTEGLASLGVTDEWSARPDLLGLFQDMVGTALIKAVFGPALLDQDPGFLRDLWAFDEVIMDVGRRLPAFLFPGAYMLRKRLLQSVKKWHARARTSAVGVRRAQNEDADDYWGCKMIRERFGTLLDVEHQDYDSVASTDLAFIWAAVTNVVPSSLTLTLQILQDVSITSDIRRDFEVIVDLGSRIRLDMKKLEAHPLLLSMYAETLRFGVQIHVPRNAPHSDQKVGNLVIPQNKMILINTWLAHTDETIWNTKNGIFPLTQFWARRFLVDPKDPTSGPTKKQAPDIKDLIRRDDDVYFTTEGLEGAWIPFGGGQHACPGRLLAKRIMLLSSAVMVALFDIELLTNGQTPKFASPRFGLGVRKPEDRLPFRIKRRSSVALDM
ncbi:MAG: hypothetical protein Q9195_009384 [Heterodermia aff. obscurata]